MAFGKTSWAPALRFAAAGKRFPGALERGGRESGIQRNRPRKRITIMPPAIHRFPWHREDSLYEPLGKRRSPKGGKPAMLMTNGCDALFSNLRRIGYSL